MGFKIYQKLHIQLQSVTYREALLMHTMLLLISWSLKPLRYKMLEMKMEYVISLFHVMGHDRNEGPIFARNNNCDIRLYGEMY